MIDLRILKNPTQLTQLVKNLKKRGFELPLEEIQILQEALKKERLEMETIAQRLNQNRGLASDKQRLKELKPLIFEKENELKEITDLIPNILHDTVPEGKGAQDNVLIEEFFKENVNPQDYMKTDMGIDTISGVNLAGARFMTLHGQAAKLHRKLINHALDFYGQKGYEEHYVPNMVKKEALYGTGQYPKFKEEVFTTQNNQELFLIPTGEVPLTNLVANQILKPEDAEKKMMTHTPCFRKEVGAAGKDTTGIIRQHQFEKVELVRTCLPENGMNNFEQMVEDVQEFVKTLNLRFRIIELCAGDIGFSGHKAYDFEVWFAHQKTWREIATITWCTDFQARRMQARFKKDGKIQLLHTLNGTGLAAGRVLAALIENHGHEAMNAF